MSEDELRRALTALAEPGTPPGGAAPRHGRRGRAAPAPDRDRRSPPASAAVGRRDRRHARRAPPDGGDRVDEPAADVGRWSTDRDVARWRRGSYETSVWTGNEMLVFGGNDARPCPPERGLRRRRRRLGSSATARRTTRTPTTGGRIADTPIDFGVAQAQLVGDEVVVVAQPAGRYDESQTWVYDVGRRHGGAGARTLRRTRPLQGLAGDRVVMLGDGQDGRLALRPGSTTAGPRCRPTRSATRSTARWSSTARDLLLLALPTEGGDEPDLPVRPARPRHAGVGDAAADPGAGWACPCGSGGRTS